LGTAAFAGAFKCVLAVCFIAYRPLMNRMKDQSPAKSDRRERLSAALRENLKRRKAQGKARSAAASETGEAAKPHDSAGIPAENDAKLR
jgi:hypothetical protein